MLSIAQSMARRGAAGVPLPPVFKTLDEAGVQICRSQLTLIVGPPSAGKSTLALNMIAKMGVPALVFLLDTNELTASARLASVLTGEPFANVKTCIINGDTAAYKQRLMTDLNAVQAVYRAGGLDDVELELEAYVTRYGLPPDCILIDNLGNQSSSFDNEWAVLKALTLQYDQLARDTQSAVIATAHTTDLDSCEPAQRTKILGKISQYPRVILSVGMNAQAGELKVAVVKNTEGWTDAGAEHPLTLRTDPSRMLVEDMPLVNTWGTPEGAEEEEGRWDWLSR